MSFFHPTLYYLILPYIMLYYLLYSCLYDIVYQITLHVIINYPIAYTPYQHPPAGLSRRSPCRLHLSIEGMAAPSPRSRPALPSAPITMV